MTLILSVQTNGLLWLLSDRRLSFENRRPVDDAVKVCVVGVSGGLAILGYAGLGATAMGTQPSQWVANTLRGRHHPLETMLEVVADAMKREFLPHLRKIKDVRQRQHSFIVPAHVGGVHRVYTIDLVDGVEGARFRFAHHIMGGALAPRAITMPIVLAGSGSAHLQIDKRWQRTLLRLVNAYNENKISAHAVSDYLARLN